MCDEAKHSAWGVRVRAALAAAIITSAPVLSTFAIVDGNAHALTLREALTATYTTNPSLAAARARLDVTKQLLARAKALGRPNIFASGEVRYGREYVDDRQGRPLAGGSGPSSVLSATLQQPLFRGFSIASGIREAKAEIYAGHADLLQSEQVILLSAVSAYVNSWRYQSFIGLRQLNVTALREQVIAARERRTIGEATATDVLQSEARQARAEAELSQTKANLRSTYAEFERIIAQRPVNLQLPKVSSIAIPRTPEEALQTALNESPLILAAQRRRQASRHALDKVRGELLPRADMNATYARSSGDDRLSGSSNGAAVSARVVVPLYQGGDVRARIREATHAQRQRRFEAEEAERRVRSDIVSAWHQLKSLKAQIRLNRRQVDRSRIALIGLLEQERRGPAYNNRCARRSAGADGRQDHARHQSDRSHYRNIQVGIRDGPPQCDRPWPAGWKLNLRGSPLPGKIGKPRSARRLRRTFRQRPLCQLFENLQRLVADVMLHAFGIGSRSLLADAD